MKQILSESLNHFIHTFHEILFSCLIYFLNLSLYSVVKLYFAHKQLLIESRFHSQLIFVHGI